MPTLPNAISRHPSGQSPPVSCARNCGDGHLVIPATVGGANLTAAAPEAAVAEVLGKMSDTFTLQDLHPSPGGTRDTGAIQDRPTMMPDGDPLATGVNGLETPGHI